MYFDNYIKTNPTTINNTFSNPSFLTYNQQPLTSYQRTTPNVKPFFNPRLTENSQISNTGFNKNNEEQLYHGRPLMVYQTGTVVNNTRVGQFQTKSNNISFHNESTNPIQNRDNNQLLKRRDSHTGNQNFQHSKNHSPANYKRYTHQIPSQNTSRATLGNQPQSNIHPHEKNNTSSNNLTKTDFIQPNDHNQVNLSQQNKQQKDLNQQSAKDKSGIYNQMYFSQLKFEQGKLSAKPYAMGFKRNNQTFQIDQRRNSQLNLKFKDKQTKNQTNKDISYNFQVKNINTDWNLASKRNQSTNKQSKLFTPSLIKKQSFGLRQEHSTQPKNDSINTENQRVNNIVQQKQPNRTERELNKSPSIDVLLSNNCYKDNLKKKINQNQNLENGIPLDGGSRINEKQQKSVSSTQLAENDRKPRGSKNYQTLIENLQKKFTQQKKSSESFQFKEKTYQAEIDKRQDKIKTLQTIVDSNKQTIQSMDETIKQLRKKNQVPTNSKEELHSNIEFKALIEGLKKENFKLKEELAKQKKNSTILVSSKFKKQSQENNGNKIQQLQMALSQANKQRQNQLEQISSLRESYSTLHLQYKTQFKEHHETKNQLHNFKANFNQISQNIQSKTETIEQINKQLVYLQSKYEGSLQKILIQSQTFEQQKHDLQQKIKNLQTQKQSMRSQMEQMRSQMHRLQNEINFKQMQIKNLEEKITQTSSWDSNLKDSQFQIDSYELMARQLQNIKQKIRLKEKTSEQLTQQLQNKTRLLETVISQKSQLECKIEHLEIKIHNLCTKDKINEGFTNDQSPKKTSDSNDVKTSSPYSSNQLADYREIQSLLDLYHQKYAEIVGLFNLTESSNEKVQNTQAISLLPTIHQTVDSNQQKNLISPSKNYINRYHPLIADEIRKIFKDLKKLVIGLKQCETQSQQKNIRLYELDKTLKKQANRINALMAEIHVKNMTITDINQMQMENEIFRLNEKYQILYQIAQQNQ